MIIGNFDQLLEKINMDRNINDIEVSVWCITYNHVDYIEKAIRGFIDQQTNFNYEIVIFDDASTDGTTEIIREYADKYPDIIKAIIARENTYCMSIRKELMVQLKNENLRGKYIANCEGDDYWIYPLKLQRQYEILENDKSIAMSIHNAIRFDGDKPIPQILDSDSSYVSEKEIFLCSNGRPPTASFFYRREYIKTFSDSYYKCPVGDDSFRYHMNECGKIHYLDKCWTVRNYMHEGSWNKKIDTNRLFFLDYCTRFYEYYNLFDIETNHRHHQYIEMLKEQLCIRAYLRFQEEDTAECKIKVAQNLIKKFGRGAGAYINKIALKNIKQNDDYYDEIKRQAINRKTFIYGAGIEAKKLAIEFEKKDIAYEGFVVTELNNNPSQLFNKMIYEFENVKYKNDMLFVLGLNEKNRNEVIQSVAEYEIFLI